MRKNPFSSLTAVNCPRASGLDAVTVAPGRTAPLVSTIFPVMVPVVARWADAAAGAKRSARTIRDRAKADMVILLGSKPNRSKAHAMKNTDGPGRQLRA